MDNILVKYFNARLEAEQRKQETPRKGPVITISRMAGCPAGLVAEALLKKLRHENIGPDPRHWRIVSKEVLSEAARALGLSEQKINYVFESGSRTTMDEVIEALSSRYYKSDVKIRKTIADVIRTIAASGSVILIGRGSVALTQDIPGSLHIRLQAPEDWRVQKLMAKQGWSWEEALKVARDWDRRRNALIQEFANTRDTESLFHASFSCHKVDLDSIVEATLCLLQR